MILTNKGKVIEVSGNTASINGIIVNIKRNLKWSCSENYVKYLKSIGYVEVE